MIRHESSAPAAATIVSISSSPQLLRGGKALRPLPLLAIAGLLSLMFVRSAEALQYSYQTLQAPDAVGTMPLDVNNNGVVVGVIYDEQDYSYGFIWQDGVFDVPEVEFEDLTFNGINDAGVIVGAGLFDELTLSIDSFTFVESVFDPIAYPGAFITFAEAINNSGDVAGVFVDDFGFGFFNAFVKRGDEFEELVAPGFVDVFVADINDEGVVVGGAYDDDDFESGLIFRDGVVEEFNHPDGGTELLGINNLGMIAGGVFPEGSDVGRSFVFDGENFHDVEVPGADETVIWGINDHGVIVGTYYVGDGEFGFVGTPVPEPASLVLLATGLAGARRRGRRTARPGR